MNTKRKNNGSSFRKKITNSILGVAVLTSFGMATGCGKDDSTVKVDEEKYRIYQLAKSAGVTDLTYEEWLVSVKGEKGDKGDAGHTPVITIGNNGNWYIDNQDTGVKAAGSVGQTGADGTKWSVGTSAPTVNTSGSEGDFYFDNLAQKIYRKENGVWVEKASITDGQNGLDGKQVEFRTSGAYVQWSYVGESNWTNLIAFDDIDGADGREIELQKGPSNIQWRYEGETEWNDLVTLASLKGDAGEDGKEVELQTTSTHIQWRYKGDAEWTDLVTLTSLKGEDGEDGKAVEFQTTSTHIQWRYEGESEWTDLVSLSTFKGEPGENGKEVELQTTSTHIQWRYKGDTEWTDLVTLSSLKGDPGDNGKAVEFQKTSTHIQWKYVGTESWTDLVAISELKGDAGSNANIIGLTASTPITISSAQEFYSKLKNADSNVYTYFKLTGDIDLNDITDTDSDNYNPEIFSSTYHMIESFYGQIDGDGYTITMSDEYRGSSKYSMVIKEFNGTLKNATLHFPNINFETSWASQNTKATTFENIKTTGSINAGSATNHSLFINWVYEDISFIDCTNECDIVNDSYGAIFLGGGIGGGNKYGISEGLVPDIKIKFINCINLADFTANYASMLYGNSSKLPTKENLVIQNCINYGNILGLTEAKLFSAVGINNTAIDPGTGDILYEYRSKELIEYNMIADKQQEIYSLIAGEKVDGNNDKNGQPHEAGTVVLGKIIKLTNSVTLGVNKDAITKEISITGVDLDTYDVKLQVAVRVSKEDELGNVLSKGNIYSDFSITNTENTGVYDYYVVDSAWIEENNIDLTDSDVATEVSDVNIKFNGETSGIKLYKITKDSEIYYYYDVEEGNNKYDYSLGESNISSTTIKVYVYEKGTENIVGFFLR